MFRRPLKNTSSRSLLAAIVLGSLVPVITAPFAMAEAEYSQSRVEVASGGWTKASYSASGSWTIVREDGALFVELSDDFRTRNAPDLKIFLSPNKASSLTGRNATDGAVLVSPLSSNRGAQRYRLPVSDLSAYETIIIHCEAFSKLWSTSSI